MMISSSLRSMAAALLFAGAATSVLAEPTAPQREFADTMMLCNSHALLQHMYAHGKQLPGVPKAADYRELAYRAAGKEYVDPLLESKAVRDKAVEQLEALLNTKPYDGLSEKERDDHMNATWSKVITTCNEWAAAGVGKAPKGK
jgi:hypothetical protein